MSRSFDGVNDYLVSASALAALAGKTRIAVGFWIKADWANDDDILFELSANSNSNTGTARMLGNASGDNKPVVQINTSGGEGATNIGANTVPTAGTWIHTLVNFDVANTGAGALYKVESIYFGGAASAQTVIGAPASTGTFSSHVLYLMARAGSALFADGEIADFCIWAPNDDTPVGGSDATALAGGARASSVRPDEILYYWPLTGEESPEPAFIGGIAMTVSGATGTADPPTLDPPPGTEPLIGAAVRTSDTTATVTWDEPLGADYGVSVLRATGTHTEDGSGDEFGDVGYDPTTISGATVIATGETSPFLDTGLLAANTYTYALIRTGPDA